MKPPRSSHESTLDAVAESQRKHGIAVLLRVVFRGHSIVHEAPRALGRKLVCGRGVGPEGLALPDDSFASREHAAFAIAADGRVMVRDLGSRNGVRVNGIRIAEQQLSDGDVVRMGSTLIVVRILEQRLDDRTSPGDEPLAERLLGARDDDELLGWAPSMVALRTAVRRAAPSPASVLIIGETGTGKELVARALHRLSGQTGPFVPVNCSAISESLAESLLFGHQAGAFTGAHQAAVGFFRAAHRGTLFLDEIGDMPKALQPKLLRAIETRTVTPVGAITPVPCEARIVAATHVDLHEAMLTKAFRPDLYARIAQLRIELGPLRRRPEDVLLLLGAHLDPALRDVPISPDLAEALVLHRWPHNVRELVSVALQLGVWGQGRKMLGADLVAEHLHRAAQPKTTSSSSWPSEDRGGSEPPGVVTSGSLPRPRSSTPPPMLPRTKEGWMALLDAHEHNLTAVARNIGRSRTQLYRLLERYGVDRNAPPRSSE